MHPDAAVTRESFDDGASIAELSLDPDSADGDLEVRLHTRIEDVDQAGWDLLASQQRVALEAGHLAAVERARVNELEPYYLVGHDGERTRGIGHFFVIGMDFARMGDEIPAEVRRTLRSWFPDFLRLRVAECGLLTGLGQGVEADQGWMPSMVTATADAIEHVGRERGADVAIVRDVPLSARDAFAPLEERGWRPLLGFPRAELPLPYDDLEGYLAALKYKKRTMLRKYMRKLDEPGIEVRILDRFGDHADRLYQLWAEVHERSSDYEHEQLNADYFRAIDRALPDRSYVAAITRHDEIIGYFLNFVGDDAQFSAHCGIDYRYNREYAVYFNLYLAAIREACRRRMSAIDFGITTYDFKLAIGCELQPLLYYVRHLGNPELTPAFADVLVRSIHQPAQRHQPYKHAPEQEPEDLAGRSRQLVDQLRGDRTDVFRRAHSYVRMDLLRLMDLYSFFPPFEGAQEPIVEHDGKRVLMLGTNAYLGLGTHPALFEAARTALARYGTGCSGSPLLNGTLDIHVELTRALAAFMEQEDAVLFSTGYQTNVGVVSAIANFNDVVVMDELNHASLIDGATLSRARLVRYAHNDMGALEAALQRYPDRAKFVVVDGMFSMEGTVARLDRIVELAKRNGARVMVDEAHGVGVMGPGGRGVCDHFGLLDQVDLIMGTFSKSFAACGGFVAGSKKLLDSLRHQARSHVFSASMPPATVATVRAALDVIIAEPDRRRAVLSNARLMALGLQQLGYDAPYRGTPIVPVQCGDELLTLGLYRTLLERGVFVNPVLSPAVAKGKEQLRVSLMATHTTELLKEALDVFASVRTSTFPRPRGGTRDGRGAEVIHA